MDNNYLDHAFTVSSHEMDIWGYMRPTAILNICQEVAYMHSASKGLGFDRLLSMNLAWVLSRLKVEIKRLPVWREQITVRTWHKRQSGLFSLRDYIFYDSSGAEIIAVTTSWLIINLATRRISRIDKVFGSEGQLSLAEHHCDAIAIEAERILVPGQMLPISTHRVRYSDMDVNQHVNNTRYLEWACDNVQRQMQPESTLKNICINFNHEAKYDDSVAISSTPQHEDIIIVDGSIGERNIFVAQLEYETTTTPLG